MFEYNMYGNRQEEFSFLPTWAQAEVIEYCHEFAHMMNLAREIGQMHGDDYLRITRSHAEDIGDGKRADIISEEIIRRGRERHVSRQQRPMSDAELAQWLSGHVVDASLIPALVDEYRGRSRAEMMVIALSLGFVA